MQFHAPHFRHPNRNGRVFTTKRVCALQIHCADEVVDWCCSVYSAPNPSEYGASETRKAYKELRFWLARLRRLIPHTRWPILR